MKKLVLHSGGMDSTAMMLDYVETYGPENIISLGINYGQKHLQFETEAAWKFCNKRNIQRQVLSIPISQLGKCSLIDKDVEVTTDMEDQRSTVVPQRNAIFLLFAASFAEQNGCDEIVHGACVDDYKAYRDCRPQFFKLLEATIQAGRTQPIKGSEDIIEDLDHNFCNLLPDTADVTISTPLIDETKTETLTRILETHSVSVYKDSYSCYKGKQASCGRCPACVERLIAFYQNKVVDPIWYSDKISEKEMDELI